MSDVPDVPPWEPIADWLARLDDSEGGDYNPTQNDIRKDYEMKAKAIAYDIATHGTTRIDPEEMKRELDRERVL